MTQPRSHDDAVERANQAPDKASSDDIEAALQGRRQFDPMRIQKIDGCRRCREKNDKRRFAAVDPVDEQFHDGDRVTIHAVHRSDDIAGSFWMVTAMDHRRHPQLPFEDTISAGVDLVRAHARVHKASTSNRLVDVDIAHHSPSSEGPETSVIDERRQQYIVDDDDTAIDAEVIKVDPEDAPASWPEDDRRWLRDLASEHGPLTTPTHHIAPDEVIPEGLQPDSPGANPWDED